MESLDVFDTETASLEGGVCDIAIARLDRNLNIVWEVESLIDPEVPISPQASGIHHIVDEMVWASPTLQEFMQLHEFPFLRPDLVVAGHNVQFDIRMVKAVLPEEFESICTLKLARNMWPDAPDHKLQTLRYMFHLDAGTAHRAMGDVYACVNLLRHIADKKGLDLDGLLALSYEPLSLATRMPFGKHKGEALGDLPLSYVRWLIDKADNLDADLREALALRLSN